MMTLLSIPVTDQEGSETFMAINKAMRAALKALSYPDIDIKKNYKVERELVNLTSKRIIKPPLYRVWDHDIPCGDHLVPVRILCPAGRAKSPDSDFFPRRRLGHRQYRQLRRCLRRHGPLNPAHGGFGGLSLGSGIQIPRRSRGLLCCCTGNLSQRFFAGHPPEEIALIGDSAGGNLAAAVSLMARDRGEFLPAKQILIYPATAADHSETSPFPSVHENGTDYLLTSKRVCDYMDLYRSGDEDLHNPYFAPLQAADFRDQPDTLIITAEYCPLRDEAEEYGHRLMKAGNRVMIRRIPDALHGYFSLPARFVQVKRTYEIINRFLKG